MIDLAAPPADPQIMPPLLSPEADVQRHLNSSGESESLPDSLAQAGGGRGRMHEYLEVAEQLAETVVDVHRYPLGPHYDEMVFEHEDMLEVCYFDWSELPGANSRLSNDKFVIGINGNDSPERQRFTLYHEWFEVLFYPHMGYNQDAASLFWWAKPRFQRLLERANRLNWENTRTIEQAANRFAACVLMPGIDVTNVWLEERVRSIREMAEVFRVSPGAMRRRLQELGLAAPQASKRKSLSASMTEPASGNFDTSSLARAPRVFVTSGSYVH